ncbi:hypothetical protein [Bradyrhizobium sp. 141]|uniref:hypothetical protein n=1 Tax=Bradyrhizobium sp. 141 TaxID=2782617 RepID=UPI001FF7807D|nr:hypothetical protein [Bradyrhizobium sp. 141]MCK1718780.1 hypothetical protein [Bradyrhizobium sp. 141]
MFARGPLGDAFATIGARGFPKNPRAGFEAVIAADQGDLGSAALDVTKITSSSLNLP